MERVTQEATAIIEGTLTLADTAPHALPAQACRRTFLMAPRNASGGATNAGPIWCGSNLQLKCIMPDGSTDDYIHVDEQSKINVRAANANDVIWFRAEA